jgi:hypothetical protein
LGELIEDMSLDIRNADQDILWFDISMNEITFVMKVLESKKDLFGDELNKGTRDAFLFITLD